MNFLIKMFYYIDGELKIVATQFDRLEDAVEHGIKAACHSYKVYDRHGELCHHHEHHRHHHPYA